MADSTFTFRVGDELKSAFSEAAKAQDQTGAQLLRKFMRDVVERQQEQAGYDAWFRDKVHVAMESANAGRLIPAEDVEAKFSARRAETQRNLGG